MPIIDELNEYYKNQNIHAESFNCICKTDCFKKIRNFTEAQSSYIPERYEKSKTRLAFLSLDSGNGQCLEKRTPEGVRKMNESMEIVALHKGRHWYKTHDLASKILACTEDSKDDISIEESKYYFAHINCAKCSTNNKNGRNVNAKMLKKCSNNYLKEELAIIKPNILVTQGAKARDIINKLFKSSIEGNNKEFTQKINYNGTKILWVWLYHPTRYNKKNINKLDSVLNSDFLKQALLDL